jgi:hypothetical protein
MANETLLVLGGIALLIFFANSGKDTALEIVETVHNMDEIHKLWVAKHSKNIITHLMGTFLQQTSEIRNLQHENVKKMTKKQLVALVKVLGNGPPQLLRKLYNSVRASELVNELHAKQFCDDGYMTLTLLQNLFESVYKLMPTENLQSAEIFTDEMNNTLQQINTFFI